MFVVGTNNYHAITAYCYIPSSLQNGQVIILKDGNGYMNTTSVSLQKYNNNNIEYNSSLTMNTAGKAVSLVYFGGGTDGMLLSI